MKFKTAYIGLALSLIIVVIDIALRINISTPSKVKSDIELPQIKNINLSTNDTQDILSLYKNFDVVKEIIQVVEIEKPNPPKVIGIGLEKENQQNGELLSLFSGDNKISLSGIFSSSERFAVLTITSMSNNSTSVKKLITGQYLFDYKVTSIKAKSITLSRKTQSIELKIFKK